MCGLRTRPRTDVDPPRVELPSAGAYRLAALGAITHIDLEQLRSDWIVQIHNHVFHSFIYRFIPIFRKTVQRHILDVT